MIGYKTWGYAQLQGATTAPAPPLRHWARGLLVALIEYFSTVLFFGLALAALVLSHR